MRNLIKVSVLIFFLSFQSFNVFAQENQFVRQNYFPETFDGPSVFYLPGNEGREKFLKERLEKFWQERYE